MSARMSFGRALTSEFMQLARSPLAPAHLACALAAGLACGAYFAAAPWDASFGTDAFVQFLGALMPLMAGIVCGLAVDEERRAGRLANLTGAPSRGNAIGAKYAALWLAGAATLMLAVGVFATIMTATGRLTLDAAPLALAIAGLSLGSAPIYALMLALALRFGRNAAIGVGAAGLLLAFFSVGGLAHGLMTGALTAASTGPLGLEPFAWPTRLGSLAIEYAIATDAGQAEAITAVSQTAALTGTLSAATGAISLIALVAWFKKFEDGNSNG